MRQAIDNSTTGWYHGICSMMEVDMERLATCENMFCAEPQDQYEGLCGRPAKYAVLETMVSDGEADCPGVWVRYCHSCYEKIIGLPVPTNTGPTWTYKIDGAE